MIFLLNDNFKKVIKIIFNFGHFFKSTNQIKCHLIFNYETCLWIHCLVAVWLVPLFLGCQLLYVRFVNQWSISQVSQHTDLCDHFFDLWLTDHHPSILYTRTGMENDFLASLHYHSHWQSCTQCWRCLHCEGRSHESCVHDTLWKISSDGRWYRTPIQTLDSAEGACITAINNIWEANLSCWKMISFVFIFPPRNNFCMLRSNPLSNTYWYSQRVIDWSHLISSPIPADENISHTMIHYFHICQLVKYTRMEIFTDSLKPTFCSTITKFKSCFITQEYFTKLV